MKDHLDIFKTIASQYVEIDGKKLKAEITKLDKEKRINISPAFNNSIHNNISKLKIRKYIIRTGTLAACFLLFVLSYYYIQNLNKILPNNKFQEAANQPTYEMITLSVNLPEKYNISQIKQDKEETIYFIHNSTNDDVILTIKKSDNNLEIEGLKKISINNTMAYGLAKKDYSIIKFEKDGNLYTLTCKYDYNTLIEISKIIL